MTCWLSANEGKMGSFPNRRFLGWSVPATTTIRLIAEFRRPARRCVGADEKIDARIPSPHENTTPRPVSEA